VILLVFLAAGGVTIYLVTAMRDRVRPFAVLPRHNDIIVETESLLSLYYDISQSRLHEVVMSDRMLAPYYRNFKLIQQRLRQVRGVASIMKMPAVAAVHGENMSLVLDAGLSTRLLGPAMMKPVRGKLEEQLNIRIRPSEHKDQTYYRILVTKQRRWYYAAVVKNLLLLSTSQGEIKAMLSARSEKRSLDNDDAFLQVDSTLRGSSNIVLLAKTDTVRKRYLPARFKAFLRGIKLSPWIGISSRFVENRFRADFFLPVNEITPQAKDHFPRKPFTRNPHVVMPKSTTRLAVLNIDKFGSLFALVQEMAKADPALHRKIVDSSKQIEFLVGMPLKKFIFSWLGSEIIAGTAFSGEPLVCLKLLDSNQARKAFTDMEKKLRGGLFVTAEKPEEYEGHTITHLNASLFFQPLLKLFAPKLKTPYYTFLNNYLVFANSSGTLKKVIDAGRANRFIDRNPAYTTINKEVPRRSNAYLYYDYSDGGSPSIPGGNRLLNRIIRAYHKGAVTVSFGEDRLEGRLAAQSGATAGPTPLAGWPRDVNKLARVQALDIDGNDGAEILTVSRDGMMRLFSPSGEPLATRQTDGDHQFVFSGELRGGGRVTPGYVIGKRVFCHGEDLAVLPGWPKTVQEGIAARPIITKVSGRRCVVVLTRKRQILTFDVKGRVAVHSHVGLDADYSGIAPYRNVGYVLWGDRNGKGVVRLVRFDGEGVSPAWNEPFEPGGHVTAPPLVTRDPGGEGWRVIMPTTGPTLAMAAETGHIPSGWPVKLNGNPVGPPRRIPGRGEDTPARLLLYTDDGGNVYGFDGKRISGWEKPSDLFALQVTGTSCRDLDGDGTPEFLAAHENNKTYAWSLTGEQRSGWPVAGSLGLRVLDLNRDNTMNVVLGGWDGQVRVYEIRSFR